MAITFNNATKNWEIWQVADDDTTTFIGTAKTYTEARKKAGL